MRTSIRSFVAGALLAGVLGVVMIPLGAQGPFSAQIENFWRLISTGGRTFQTVKVTKGLFGDGSPASPAIAFAAEPLTGFDRSGTQQISAMFANGEYVRIGTGALSLLTDAYVLRFGASADARLSRVAAGTIGTSVGTGTSVGALGGTLFTSTTAASTTDLLEDTLISYTLPANTLAANGRGLRITATCISAANANAGKSCKLYFGTVAVASRTGTADNNWTDRLVAEVFRTGATSQLGFSVTSVGLTGSTSVSGQLQSPVLGETLANAIVIKVTGQGTTAIGDITAVELLVEAL